MNITQSILRENKDYLTSFYDLATTLMQYFSDYDIVPDDKELPDFVVACKEVIETRNKYKGMIELGGTTLKIPKAYFYYMYTINQCKLVKESLDKDETTLNYVFARILNEYESITIEYSRELVYKIMETPSLMNLVANGMSGYGALSGLVKTGEKKVKDIIEPLKEIGLARNLILLQYLCTDDDFKKAYFILTVLFTYGYNYSVGVEEISNISIEDLEMSVAKGFNKLVEV